MVGDIGEDGGAAGRDLVFGEEKKKAGEEVVDGEGGTEFPEVGGERGCGGRLALIFREAGVAWAKSGVDVGSEKAAAPAVGETVGAASGVVDEAGFKCLLGHVSFLCREEFGVHPWGNADGCENKGVAGKAIRKDMKTKGRKKWRVASGENEGRSERKTSGWRSGSCESEIRSGQGRVGELIS